MADEVVAGAAGELEPGVVDVPAADLPVVDVAVAVAEVEVPDDVAVVFAVVVTGWADVGVREVTGVIGRLMRADVDDADERLAELRPGTVTGDPEAVAAADELLAAELGAVVDASPTALPQAASNNTDMPCPATIRAVLLFGCADTLPPLHPGSAIAPGTLPQWSVEVSFL